MTALVKTRDQLAHTAADASEEDQYLTFLLDSETFAVGIMNIKEIIEYGQLTTVPMMPRFVRGVINLRGSVVPVIDLQVRFGRESKQANKRTCIVIVEVSMREERHVIGIVVDSVSAVLSIPNAEIEKAPAFGAKLRSDFISGMGKISEKFVIILNIDQVLSLDEMVFLSGQVEKIEASA